jgi:protein-tyrosine-phosphatase/predicted ATP-grasp superfamily ATP-dependent carboligase
MNKGIRGRKALVLGHDTRSFLSVIRSLGRGGVEVHVAWHRGGAPLRSRYIAEAHDIPPPAAEDESWKAPLVDLMDRERFELVIPCDDPSLFPLQRHRAELEPHGRIYLLDDRAFAILFDKLRTTELARSVGVRVPHEIVVSGSEESERVTGSLPLPVVLKPPASFDPTEPDARRMVRKAYSWDEFHAYLAEMIPRGPVAVQENFIGEGVGVELLLDAGEPLLAFQHVRLHEPLLGGGSSYRRSVAVSPELLEASLTLMRPLKYTGVAMVEFKVEPRTGNWVLIEVNGRFWGSLPLAVAAGADFPLALFEFLVDGKRDFRQGYREGLCSRNLISDLNWLVANLRDDRSDPTLATRRLPGVVGEALANLLLGRERLDTFTLDDIGPGLDELGEMTRRVRRAIGRKVSRRYLGLGGVRRRMSRHALAALRGAETILFVCKGNICRSPFAEQLARRTFSDDRIFHSAGYLPCPGRRSPREAIAAATSWDLDLTPHRSRVITAAMIRDADAIFIFDADTAERLTQDYREAGRRVHFVGELLPRGPRFIEDPWGGTPEDFETCYRRIASAILGEETP